MSSDKTIKVDKIIGDAFKIHCYKFDLELKEASNILFSFCLKYNVNPEDLEYIWEKRTRVELSNAKSELMNIHNLSVGFLRTFEKKQENMFQNFKTFQGEFHKKLLDNLLETLNTLEVQKTVLNEILYNTQAAIMIEDEDFGTKISNKNWENIILSEKKTNDNQIRHTKE